MREAEVVTRKQFESFLRLLHPPPSSFFFLLQVFFADLFQLSFTCLSEHISFHLCFCVEGVNGFHFLVWSLQKWGQTLSPLSVSQILIPAYYLCPSPALRRNHLGTHVFGRSLKPDTHSVTFTAHNNI